MTGAGDPKARAAAVRERLDIRPKSPIHDALESVEDGLDIPVSVLDLGTEIAGAYVVRRERPFILINGTDSPYRRRFTLAHELGHHELGHSAVVDEKSIIGATGAVDPRERDANLFAAEFLAPRAALDDLLADMGNPPITINLVVHVADFFGISPPAAFVRLCGGGLVEDRRAEQRIRDGLERGDHYGAAAELGITPFADSLTSLTAADLPRLPATLRQNALNAYQSGLITLARLAEILDRPESEVVAQLERVGITPVQTAEEE